jgi:transposase InsO family protein
LLVKRGRKGRSRAFPEETREEEAGGSEKGGDSKEARNRKTSHWGSPWHCIPHMPYLTLQQVGLATGTSSHIATMCGMFTNFTPRSESIRGVGEAMCLKSRGHGTVVLLSKVNGQTVPITIHDVMYAPSAQNCLMSVNKVDEKGSSTTFSHSSVTVSLANGTKVAQGKLFQRVYRLDVRVKITEEHANAVAEAKPELWDEIHCQFSHVSISSLKRLANSGIVDRLIVDPKSEPTTKCTACIQGKAHWKSFPKETAEQNHSPGDLTYSDLWGPAHTQSLGGSRYYISFMDDAMRHNTMMFLKEKSEAVWEVKNYVAWIETHFSRKPKYLHFNNGSKFINKDLKAWCAEHGINIQTTAPYSPEQHGIAEWLNHTLIELTCSMLIAQVLPTFLWAEAVKYTSYIW